MDNWWNSNLVIAILSSIFSLVAVIGGSWYSLRKKGISSSTAAEIVDRARFRSDLMRRVEQLSRDLLEVEKRLLRSEKEHEECTQREFSLRARVAELEIEVKSLRQAANVAATALHPPV